MTTLAEILIVSIPPAIVYVTYSLFGRLPRQPAGSVCRAFGAGLLAIIPVILISLLIPGPIVGHMPENLAEVGRMFVLTGLTEETAKLTALAIFAWPPAWSQSPRHAVTTGSAVGFGFGFAETILAGAVGSGSVVLRSLLVSPFHALTTATLALLFSLRLRFGAAVLVGGLLVLAVVHTGFNLVLLWGSAGIALAAVALPAWTAFLLRSCGTVKA